MFQKQKEWGEPGFFLQTILITEQIHAYQKTCGFGMKYDIIVEDYKKQGMAPEILERLKSLDALLKKDSVIQNVIVN